MAEYSNPIRKKALYLIRRSEMSFKVAKGHLKVIQGHLKVIRPKLCFYTDFLGKEKKSKTV